MLPYQLSLFLTQMLVLDGRVEELKEGCQSKSEMVKGLLQHRECRFADDRQVSVGEYISPAGGRAAPMGAGVSQI